MKKVDPSVPVIFLVGTFVLTCFVSLAMVYPAERDLSLAENSSQVGGDLQANEISNFSTNTDGDQDLESHGRPAVQGASTINFDELPADEPEPVPSQEESRESNNEGVVNNDTVSPPVTSAPQTVPVNQSGIASEIIQEINRIRTSLGLVALAYSQPATNMAVSRCEDMAKAESLLDHSDLQTRQEYFGVLPPATVAAENLAYFSSSSASYVVSKWMESAVHRDNIVNPNFTKMGSGSVERNGLFYYAIELSN